MPELTVGVASKAKISLQGARESAAFACDVGWRLWRG